MKWNSRSLRQPCRIRRARLEDILWNTVLALMLASGTTLLDILRMFGPDDAFREKVLQRVGNPVVRNSWVQRESEEFYGGYYSIRPVS